MEWDFAILNTAQWDTTVKFSKLIVFSPCQGRPSCPSDFALVCTDWQMMCPLSGWHFLWQLGLKMGTKNDMKHRLWPWSTGGAIMMNQNLCISTFNQNVGPKHVHYLFRHILDILAFATHICQYIAIRWIKYGWLSVVSMECRDASKGAKVAFEESQGVNTDLPLAAWAKSDSSGHARNLLGDDWNMIFFL